MSALQKIKATDIQKLKIFQENIILEEIIIIFQVFFELIPLAFPDRSRF